MCMHVLYTDIYKSVHVSVGIVQNLSINGLTHLNLLCFLAIHFQKFVVALVQLLLCEE